MSRPFDFSQMPSDGVIILPELPPNPAPGKALVVDTVAPDGRVQLMFSATGSGGGSGGTTTVTISDTPPVAPLAGALWFDSTNAQLFLRYDDGSSSQWVVANTVGPAAPGGGVTPAGVASFNTRTGAVTLSNADVITVLPSGNTLPVMDGAAAAGVATAWSRQDHVHPTDTTLAPKNSPVFTGTPSLPTGTIAVTQAPGTANTAPATTAFVTTAVGAVQAGAVIADTPPALNPGGLWWDSTGGQLYVRYNDGTSTAYVAATNIEGLANAATKAEVAAALNNVGRNLLHNSMFNVAQRGVGPWTGIGYTIDRWLVSTTLDTISITNNAAADSDRVAIGDEAVTRLLVNNFTGNAGATAVNYAAQGIEGVYRLAGKAVTVSFWARCGAGALKLGIGMFQYFGTGGSPSTSVGLNGQPVTLSTSWARYNLTFVLPSIAGKTVGTNGDNATWFQFFFSSGANNAASAGGIGVQSGAIVLWGIQLEIGSVATPLEKPDPQVDLANCQRFNVSYASGGGAGIWIYTNDTKTGAWGLAESRTLPVQMRAVPTVTLLDAGSSGITGMTASALNANSVRVIGTGSAGVVSFNVILSASADL